MARQTAQFLLVAMTLAAGNHAVSAETPECAARDTVPTQLRSFDCRTVAIVAKRPSMQPAHLILIRTTRKQSGYNARSPWERTEAFAALRYSSKRQSPPGALPLWFSGGLISAVLP